MSDFNKKYQELISELEKSIKDKNELNQIKGILSELVIFLTDRVSKSVEMESDINKIDRNVRRLQKRIEEIEEDIYVDIDEDVESLEKLGYDQMHDHDYEFEIICPYCDYEFITDNSYKNNSTIKCPKCKKIIELDWNFENNNSSNLDENEYYYEEENDTENKKQIAENNEKYSIDVKTPKNEKYNNSKNKKNKNEEDEDEDM
ncbi:MAG: hypothetical protein IKG14_05455 [Clostridia bacterium]|nr:hypothetical protein [Clostridia bacterium]